MVPIFGHTQINIITHRIHGAAIYGAPWIPSIYPLYVSIYASTMDLMGSSWVFATPRLLCCPGVASLCAAARLTMFDPLDPGRLGWAGEAYWKSAGEMKCVDPKSPQCWHMLALILFFLGIQYILVFWHMVAVFWIGFDFNLFWSYLWLG